MIGILTIELFAFSSLFSFLFCSVVGFLCKVEKGRIEERWYPQLAVEERASNQVDVVDDVEMIFDNFAFFPFHCPPLYP